MWVHSINDNAGPIKSGNLISRRWFFHRKNGNCTTVELALFNKISRFSNSINFSKGAISEYTILISFCIPFLISFYLSFDWMWLEKRKWYSKFLKEDLTEVERPWGGKGYKSLAKNRELGIRIWSGYAEVSFFDYEDHDSRNRKSISINIVDFLLGEEKTTDKILRRERVEIPFLEKNVRAECTIKRKYLKRPRWVKNSRLVGEIKLQNPIEGQDVFLLYFDHRKSRKNNLDYLVSETIGHAVTTIDYIRKTR